LNWVKGWYSLKVATGPEEGQSDAQNSTDMVDSSHDMLNYNHFDYMDDVSWQELMVDLNYIPMQ